MGDWNDLVNEISEAPENNPLISIEAYKVIVLFAYSAYLLQEEKSANVDWNELVEITAVNRQLQVCFTSTISCYTYYTTPLTRICLDA